eukprot:CAMPEP_0198721050 /NCGR_PEP_ID=MMETSP1471-20131121/64676_1 /TAXON_ID=41880 /ORGANISM="Pycnococcus provasolii, Strain RCC733" /LENGTH=312 /DNA_ID=CAMNT_0044481929 /DNA_START=705 /DNA_END=1643 /DNA_ORIENTATION=+
MCPSDPRAATSTQLNPDGSPVAMSKSLTSFSFMGVAAPVTRADVGASPKRPAARKVATDVAMTLFSKLPRKPASALTTTLRRDCTRGALTVFAEILGEDVFIIIIVLCKEFLKQTHFSNQGNNKGTKRGPERAGQPPGLTSFESRFILTFVAISMAACPRVKTTSLRFPANPLRHTQRRSVVVSSSSTLRDAEKLVTLHPYFRVAADADPAVKVLCAQFEERTQNEKDALYYHFTWCQKDGDDDILFCREAYTSADAVKIHLANVGDLLDELLSLTTLERLEVHGTSSELAELHEALDPLGADFYYANGVAN